MRRFATILALAASVAFSGAQMAASTRITQPRKAAPTSPLHFASPNTAYNFVVTDESGPLLTCAKQQIDTDTYSGCTFAPGRTLDDLMTTFIRGIRAEQLKDKAEQK